MSENTKRYVRPEVKTLTAGEVVESFGPVSCGSASGAFGQEDADPISIPIGRNRGGKVGFF
jgi:hypothetical protein